MEIIKTIAEMREYRRSIQAIVGFVPTMGALHEGHLSLMRRSESESECSIVSIFVNPTQFGANEDFDKYPRTLEKDLELCEKEGVDAVFIPNVNEMYKNDEITLNPPKKMGYIFEGFDRPTHFSGVLQVVLKLFNIIRPHKAFFGQKDAQQVLILQKMVEQFFLNMELIPCPIVRDSDGLALSSRNIYLSDQERRIALRIPQTIELIESCIQEGETNAKKLEKKAFENLHIEGLEPIYASFVNHCLEPIEKIVWDQSIFLITARVGKTRLLDNLWI